MFFPTDIHMPSIAINIPKEVKKVVVKVKVAEIQQEQQVNIVEGTPPIEE